MLAILCGIVEERRIIAESGALVLCGAAAAANLERFIPKTCTSILSFGVCGALAPALHVGDLVLGTAVNDAKMVYPADPAWCDKLGASLERLPTHRGSVLSVSVEVGMAPEERAQLLARTECCAVDDESNAVAQFANVRRIPFAVLRAVSDDARATVPAAARNAMLPNGRANMTAVFSTLRAEPSELFGLEKTAFNFSRAIGRLWDAYRAVGPNFCVA